MTGFFTAEDGTVRKIDDQPKMSKQLLEAKPKSKEEKNRFSHSLRSHISKKIKQHQEKKGLEFNKIRNEMFDIIHSKGQSDQTRLKRLIEFTNKNWNKLDDDEKAYAKRKGAEWRRNIQQEEIKADTNKTPVTFAANEKPEPTPEPTPSPEPSPEPPTEPEPVEAKKDDKEDSLEDKTNAAIIGELK